MTAPAAAASAHPARPVAVVTGAASGIGRATAERFAVAGYHVVVNDLGERGELGELAAGLGGTAVAADVADAAAMTELVRVAAGFGPLAVVVSNAGFYVERPLAETDDALWDRMLRVHLGGLLNLARAAAPIMRARGDGAIVGIASELALAGSHEAAAYVAAKAAVIGLVRSLARELAPAIRVNAVAPGPVDTPLLPDRDREPAALAAIPLGRLGHPDEIATAILAVAEATWTTGQVVSPNGGTVIQ